MARTSEQISTKENPDAVTQARENAPQMLLEINLNQLRERLALAGKEPVICDQNPSVQYVTLMTLKRWVESAGGGNLYIDVELPNGAHYMFTA